MFFLVLLGVPMAYLAWILLTDPDQRPAPGCQRDELAWGTPRVMAAGESPPPAVAPVGNDLREDLGVAHQGGAGQAVRGKRRYFATEIMPARQ